MQVVNVMNGGESKLRTLGLIGGTSWLSTIDYYRIINQGVNERLGGINSAKLFMYSLNLEELNNFGFKGNWPAVAEMFSNIAVKLQTAGAECIVICANTPHKVADDIRKAIKIPLIHIAEVTADAIVKKMINKVGLLGTKYTMEDSFFSDKLADRKISTIIPGEDDRRFIHDTILGELGRNVFSPETKARYLRIINGLISDGAQGVILGCTEIPLLIKQEDCAVPLFDTGALHAQAALEFALGKY